MSGSWAVGVLRASQGEGSSARRVRTYLVVNLVAIWTSVAALAVLSLRLGPSRALTWNIGALAGAGVAYGIALLLTNRGRMSAAAGVALVSTWVVAFLLTWATPIITPVGLIILHVPSLILADAFRLRTRSALLGASVPLTGLLAGVGESRRDAWGVGHPDVPAPGVLVGLFTGLVAAVLVIGIRDYVLRIARNTRDLEESRARLAVAGLEARRAIERDLHDGAQQQLAACAVDVGRLARVVDSDPERARAIAEDLQSHVQGAIRELRDLARGIYPPLLAERGLAAALPAAARRTTLPCVVDVQGLRRHPRDVEAAVYFCCLEAIQNADRHSGASLITVRVSDEGRPPEETLCFEVTDDGAGFDIDARGRTHGLTGMRDRVQSAGGVLEVRSAPGRGTTVVGRFGPRTGR